MPNKSEIFVYIIHVCIYKMYNLYFIVQIGQRAIVSHNESVLRVGRMLSSDHRNRLSANTISSRQSKQNGFLDTVLPNQKHLRLKQTQYRFRETKDKIKKTQQRLKESKQRIINDIKDTKTMMKERMENIIEVSYLSCFFNVMV